jgi:uncharacterized membrane protein
MFYYYLLLLLVGFVLPLTIFLNTNFGISYGSGFCLGLAILCLELFKHKEKQ